MSEQVRFDDYEHFARIEARGFIPWGPPVMIGKDSVEAFLTVTGATGDPATIPGVMLQAMLPKLIPGHDWSVTGHSGAVNMGSPSIRFPVPAKSGAQLCGRSRLASAKPHAKGTIVTMEFEIREEGAETPCLQSSIELLYLGARS